MNATIEVTKEVTTLINLLTVEPEINRSSFNSCVRTLTMSLPGSMAGSRPASSLPRISVMCLSTRSGATLLR